MERKNDPFGRKERTDGDNTVFQNTREKCVKIEIFVQLSPAILVMKEKVNPSKDNSKRKKNDATSERRSDKRKKRRE